jgi:arginine/lysine/ornithine decarboxylase
MFQSSSPSYLLLCSLDVATDVAASCPTVWEEALRAARHVRHAWRASGGKCLGDSDTSERCSNEKQAELRTDPLRLTLLATEHGFTGYEFAERLEQHGLAPEMATETCVVLALGIGSTMCHSVRAAEAFQKALPDCCPSRMLDSEYSPREPEVTAASIKLANAEGVKSKERMDAVPCRARVCTEVGAEPVWDGRQGCGIESQPSNEDHSAADSNLGPKHAMTSCHTETVADESAGQEQAKGGPMLQQQQQQRQQRLEEIECISKSVTVVTGVREAATGGVEEVGWQEALEQGAVCGGLISVYPPGVPVLVYGEPVSEGAVQKLQQAVACGAKLVGCSSDLSDIPIVLCC